jgi:hypothetical protein
LAARASLVLSSMLPYNDRSIFLKRILLHGALRVQAGCAEAVAMSGYVHIA